MVNFEYHLIFLLPGKMSYTPEGSPISFSLQQLKHVIFSHISLTSHLKRILLDLCPSVFACGSDIRQIQGLRKNRCSACDLVRGRPSCVSGPHFTLDCFPLLTSSVSASWEKKNCWVEETLSLSWNVKCCFIFPCATAVDTTAAPQKQHSFMSRTFFRNACKDSQGHDCSFVIRSWCSRLHVICMCCYGFYVLKGKKSSCIGLQSHFSYIPFAWTETRWFTHLGCYETAALMIKNPLWIVGCMMHFRTYIACQYIWEKIGREQKK